MENADLSFWFKSVIKRIQEFRNSGIQEFRNSGIQELGIQEFERLPNGFRTASERLPNGFRLLLRRQLKLSSFRDHDENHTEKRVQIDNIYLDMKISSNEFSNCRTGFFVKHRFRKERLISHPDDDPSQLIGKRQYQVYCRILKVIGDK